MTEATGADAEIPFEIMRKVRRIFVTQFERHVLECCLVSNQLDRSTQPQTLQRLVRCSTVLNVKVPFQLPGRYLAFERELCRTIPAGFGQRGPIFDMIQTPS